MLSAVFAAPTVTRISPRLAASFRSKHVGCVGIVASGSGGPKKFAGRRDDDQSRFASSRRNTVLGGVLTAFTSPFFPPAAHAVQNSKRAAGDTGEGPFCDFTQTLPCDEYTSYDRTKDGLLFQDLRFGDGAEVTPHKQVVCDWDAYTFYLSHVVQARHLPKGSDFAESDMGGFLRFTPGNNATDDTKKNTGDQNVLPAFASAVVGMRVGGIRRFIVRPDSLSYPGILSKRGGRFDEGVGPVPESLSGKRALEFVLRNTANVDKSLLFDVEVLAVEGDGNSGFKRGPGRWAEGVKSKTS